MEKIIEMNPFHKTEKSGYKLVYSTEKRINDIVQELNRNRNRRRIRKRITIPNNEQETLWNN